MSQSTPGATSDRRPVYARLPVPLTRLIKADAALNDQSIQQWLEDAARDKLGRGRSEPTEAE